MREINPVSSRFRRLVLSALIVLAPLVATAAAAWACTPSAGLKLDRSTYEAGSTIIANGGGFPPNGTVSVTPRRERTGGQRTGRQRPDGFDDNGQRLGAR